MSTLVCNHEIRPSFPLAANCTDLNRKDEFDFINSYLRRFEEEVKNWPEVARLCIRVRDAELWKEGGFHSWTDWIQKTAPVSARTVFYRIGVFEQLQADFTPEEMAEMPAETAKRVTRLSKSARKNPKVRAATKKKPREFVETVKQEHPNEHLENSFFKSFELTESQSEKVEAIFDVIRAEHEGISEGMILEMLCIEWEQTHHLGENV